VHILELPLVSEEKRFLRIQMLLRMLKMAKNKEPRRRLRRRGAILTLMMMIH